MSAALDEDTARAINTGRETIGVLLSSAQTHLQKVFIAFVIGFIGTFYALRVFIWEFLEATAKAEMGQYVADSTDIITRTPFEVILLQAKIGMFVGVLVAIPVLLYFSRDALRRRGVESVVPISRRYLVAFGTTAVLLFLGGITYAYSIFFPYAFDFLASNAVSAGVKPSFGITEFTEFIVLLTLSFGLAAQLPLFMSVLSYTEIVPYETFRDKWRHAIVGVTVFGALFSPPDPFTLIMWAMPMVALYVFSLGLAKVVTNVRRRGAAESAGSGASHIKVRVLQFAGVILAVSLAATLFVIQDGFAFLQSSVYPHIPELVRPEGAAGLESIAAEYGTVGDAIAGFAIGLSIGFVVLIGYTISVLRSPVYPRQTAIMTADEPDEIDFEILDADDVETVSAAVFLAMEEDEALEYARQAMYDDDRDKAQAILDRYDTLQAEAKEADEEGGDAGAESEAGADAGTGAGASASDTQTGASETEASGGLFASTAAGVLDPFTEDETTEDDIGGYAYDIAFIFNSLTSKMFRIVGTFMLVMGGTFFWLYSGGLGYVLRQFVDRVPDSVLYEVAERNEVEGDPAQMTTAELIDQLDLVIALHPVEVLIFEVKVSVLAAIIAVLPMILYYAWPAMKERGLAYGDRRVFVVWGGSLLAGFAFGIYLGFFWIAPAVISYLVTDALTNGMVISYRIKHFFWLVIFTTVGIGFLFNIIVTMALFHVGGVLHYRTMRDRWRPVVVGIFAVAAFASPRGILTMLVFAIPLAITYLIGLAVLALLTLNGRLFGGGGGRESGISRFDPDPKPEPDTE